MFLVTFLIKMKIKHSRKQLFRGQNYDYYYCNIYYHNNFVTGTMPDMDGLNYLFILFLKKSDCIKNK